MNTLAKQLNETIEKGNPHLLEMMSQIGLNLFFPKGILTQGAEAKEKAYHINATVGIAKEQGRTMRLDSIMLPLRDIRPAESLTYAPSFGIPALRQMWQQKIFEKNPSLGGKTISLPIVTCGITHGVSVFADIWIDPGDVILLPEMMWGNYTMVFGVRKGAAIQQFSTFNQQGGFNLASLEDKIKAAADKHKKIVVILNFPHNPSGYTITRREAETLVKILTDAAASGTNIIAATDDSYFGLFYEEDTLKESPFALLADQHPRLLAVKLDGCTKENFVWGLRVGFVTYSCRIEGDPAPVYDALEKKTAGCVRGSISNASHLSQTLVLKSMQDERFPEEIREKFDILKQRAGRVKKVLADPKYKEAWDVYPFNSGYFMCIRLKSVNAEALRVHLLKKYGIGLISLGERNLRIAFSCIEESEIAELFDTILKGVQELD